MHQDIGLLARTVGCAKNSGARRLTLEALLNQGSAQTQREADLAPGKVLSALKKAAPFLGISARCVHAIDWLFSFTKPIDWEPGGTPIVWPSAALMRESLGIGITQAKMLTRTLIECGLVRMKESPNGKRYGRRSPDGRIIEAFGFDLSPLAERHKEFLATAEQGQSNWRRAKHLRRKTTILRRAVQQLMLAAEGLDATGQAALKNLSSRVAHLVQKISRAEDVSGLEPMVLELERFYQDALRLLQNEKQTRLEKVPGGSEQSVDHSVSKAPLGSENRPDITPTDSTLYLERDYVEKSASRRDSAEPDPVALQDMKQVCGRSYWPGKKGEGSGKFALNPMRLLEIAPRLRPYVRTKHATWLDIIEAADWLRHEMRVPNHGWAEACVTMGRESAAISVALISTKSPNHIRVAPGAYLYGMIKAAKAGSLDLDRSLWGATQVLKEDRYPTH